MAINDVVQYETAYCRVLYNDGTIGVIANIDHERGDELKIIKLDYVTINLMKKIHSDSLLRLDRVWEKSERETNRLKSLYLYAELDIAEVKKNLVTEIKFESGQIQFTFENNSTYTPTVGDQIYFYARIGRPYTV